MLLHWVLSLAIFTSGFAEERLPAECKRVPQYDFVVRKYGVSLDYTKSCREAVSTIMSTWQGVKTAKQRATRTTRLNGDETQAGMLNDAANVGAAGAITSESYAQIAARAKTQFTSVEERLGNRVKQLEKEANLVMNNGSVSAPLKAEFRSASDGALDDYKKLHAMARRLAAEAAKVSGEYREEANQLDAMSRRTRESAERLEGDQPAQKKEGVSKNLLIGLGGAALITAGAVGGLYWVSQKAIKSADDAAAARIAQAETSANNVIKNAEETAKRIITFATNSLNQIIANAEQAANRIYDRAKNDVDKLITDLRAEIQETFANLTETGLKKLRTEMETMFNGLIARAKAAGDKALEDNLKKVWDSLNGQINSEIASRQGTSTGTSTSTGTGTGTTSSTSTGTSTGTTTGTSTNSATSTASSTATATSTASSTATSTVSKRSWTFTSTRTDIFTYDR